METDKRYQSEFRCKKCDELVHGNFCSNCGCSTMLKKIDGRYILNELRDVLFVNSGLFFTIKSMIIEPGKAVRRFIAEDRSPFVKPILFLFVTTIIYAIVNYLFHFAIQGDSSYVNPFFDTNFENFPTLSLMYGWMMGNMFYSEFMGGLLMAFGLKIFFRKSNYNIFEMLILMCFVSGITTLFFSIASIIQSFINVRIFDFASLFAMVYFTWAAGQFFGEKKASNYIKALLSYMLAVSMLTIATFIVGATIDVVFMPHR